MRRIIDKTNEIKQKEITAHKQTEKQILMKSTSVLYKEYKDEYEK